MIAQLVQSIGLIFDLIGVILIVHGFKKVKVEESSPFGFATNMVEILTELKNEARLGSCFLVGGFLLQLIGLWI